MRREGRVGKSCVIYALEMGFTLLNKRNGLIISTAIGCVAEDIRRSTMHTALSISTYKTKNLYTNISGIWTHWSLLIINKLSMIQLELFAKMDKQLHKTRDLINSLMTLFNSLFLIILIGDFYQFGLVSGRLLWDRP